MPQAQTSHVRQTPSVLASVIPPEVVTPDVAEEVVNVARYTYSGSPDAVVLSDGANWLGEWTPNNWDYGGQQSYKDKYVGIHTGTRFLIPIFTSTSGSRTILQRKTGETWSWDNKTILWFDYYDNSTYIYTMASSKTGNVYVGGYYIGDGSPAQNNYIFGLARSDDSGDTWTACDYTANSEVYAAAAWQDEVLIWWSGGATDFAYSADAGVTWVDAGNTPGDGEFSMNDMCVSNGHWFLGGSGGGSGEADTVLYTTTNPLNGWTPVNCPWTGYYGPLQTYNGTTSHLSDSGVIYSLFACDARICALGQGVFASSAQILLSDDSGATWTEVGTEDYASLLNYGWEGVYIIPDAWSITVEDGEGAAFGFDRWWITNDDGGSSTDPPMISVAGDLSNVYAHQSPMDNYNYAYMGVMISTASA